MKKLIIFFQALMCFPLLAQKNVINIPANSDGLVLKAEKSMVKLVENPSKTISQSAEWDWSKNADFKLFNLASTKVENPRATLVFWLYNTTPQNEKLMVKVSQDASNYFIFPFGLNFKGWRTAWVMFHRDMQVVGNPKKINFIEFLKPKNAKNGIFYLNDVRLVNEVNPRSPMQDEQLPFVNKGVEKSANAHWVALYNFAHQPKKLAETKSVTISQQNGITTIAKRLKKQILDDFDVEKNKVSFAEVQKEFNDWGIQEKNGIYSGKPVLSMNDREILKKEQLPEKHIKDFTELMLKIAILRDFSQNLTEQKILDSMFLTLLNFMHDQGWAAGSGMGALHHLGYNFEGFYESCFLMRDVIKAAGLTQQTYDDMFWFSGLGRIYTPKKDLPHSNIDVFNTLLRGMLCTILTDDNKGKIAQELKQFSWWLSENMMPTYSIRGTFKPDGAVVHHGT